MAKPKMTKARKELMAKFGVSSDEEALQKLEQIRAAKREERSKTELPHLYGFPWYKWAYDFFTSTNKINLLCAANQISKSSTQIRKCIDWATDRKEWPNRWARDPIQFWYLYPTQKQVHAEFETKWRQFLPRGEMQNDPYYGWKIEKSKGEIVAIHFNSGVHVYFKTYNQAKDALQSGTCDAIFADEELPIDIFDELMLRISASDGYFHMVFTATMGQDAWRRAMEVDDLGDDEQEFLPQAFKQVVSLYDAMFYMDGTPSPWTEGKIKMVEARCSTHQEVLKRVYGRFILIGGRKYPSFDIKRHKKPRHPIPPSWHIYEGVDVGSGGEDGHKSAICFVAVSPNYRQGRVFMGWRSPEGEVTTSGDVFIKHQKLVKDNKLQVSRKFYDWAAVDFGTIADRAGDPFEQANKSHDLGEEVINTLFKNDMMYVYDDPELAPLCGELSTIKKKGQKGSKKDDFADAFRYAITSIPWDWTVITGETSIEDEPQLEVKLSSQEQEIRDRRKAFETENANENQRIDDEISEWNEQYEGF